MTTDAIRQTSAAERPNIGAAVANVLLSTKFLATLIAGIVILVVWQVGVMLFAANFVAKPINVVQVFPKVLTDPLFQQTAWSTLTAVFQGLAIALVAGTVVGIAMGRMKVFDRALNVYVNGLYTMPMIALLPLLTI